MASPVFGLILVMFELRSNAKGFTDFHNRGVSLACDYPIHRPIYAPSGVMGPKTTRHTWTDSDLEPSVGPDPCRSGIYSLRYFDRWLLLRGNYGALQHLRLQGPRKPWGACPQPEAPNR